MLPVKVHAYEVMWSHLHLLLSGRGADCVAVFDYLKMRIDKRLREDGRPPLPKNYDFRLVPVESEEHNCVGFLVHRSRCQILPCILSDHSVNGSQSPILLELPDRLFRGGTEVAVNPAWAKIVPQLLQQRLRFRNVSALAAAPESRQGIILRRFLCARTAGRQSAPPRPGPPRPNPPRRTPRPPRT